MRAKWTSISVVDELSEQEAAEMWRYLFWLLPPDARADFDARA